MLETRNLAVMFTDIKGFTHRTSQQTRRELMDLLDRHREVVLPVAEEHGGILVKTIGDAFLITFESPTNAVLSGIAIQEALKNYNRGLPTDQRIDIRIAVNSGEVTLSDGDVYGEAVNIASRIEGLAETGEVYLGLKIIRISDGGRPELPRALLRAGFFVISVIPLGLGFWWHFFTKQTWHDRAARTRVVSVLRD